MADEQDQTPAKAPDSDGGDQRSQTLVDFGPLIVFVVAYKLRGIYWATGAFMVAATLALLYSWRREGKVRPLPLVTLVIVMVFGGMTIWLRDPRFIYVKPTIVAGLTGTILLGGLAFGRALLKPLLGSALELSDEGWRAFSFRFALFSFGLAALNEFVWRRFTPQAEHIWVWFKFLGIPGLTLIFLLAQTPMLKRFRIGDAQ